MPHSQERMRRAPILTHAGHSNLAASSQQGASPLSAARPLKVVDLYCPAKHRIELAKRGKHTLPTTIYRPSHIKSRVKLTTRSPQGSRQGAPPSSEAAPLKRSRQTALTRVVAVAVIGTGLNAGDRLRIGLTFLPLLASAVILRLER